MAIDRTRFLLMATALAAGGVGGCEIRGLGSQPSPSPAPAPSPQALASAQLPAGPMPIAVVEHRASGAPKVCDDSQGVVGECPSVGPSDEGVCPNLINKRCQEFKAAFQPRVAAQAVACLRSLKGNERCDPARINQCGHAALMQACDEPPVPWKGELVNASGSQPATVKIMPDPDAPTSPVVGACESIVKTCGDQVATPSLADCRRTLAGMNETGRANMVECVTANCTTRGLYGCEAVPKTTRAASGGT